MLTTDDQKQVKKIAEDLDKAHKYKPRKVHIRKATLNMTLEVELEGPEGIDALRTRAIDTLKKLEGGHAPDDLMSTG